MVDLSSLAIDPDVLRLIPKSTALELSVLPLSLKNDTVIVAMPEMFKRQLVADVQFLLGRKVKAVPVPQEILLDAIHRFYEGTSNGLGHTLHAATIPFRSATRARLQTQLVSDTSTTTLANRLIGTGIRIGATDIHVEPYGEAFRIRYRVDGVLHEAVRLDEDKARPLVLRLKTMAHLSIADTLHPQEGRTRVRRADRSVDIRISTLPTDAGEKVTIRILDKSRLQLHPDKLGLEEHDFQLFQHVLRSPSGLVLVTGPEGSGKVTTLYASLTSINRPDISIATIEDPVEYDLPGINQTMVRPDLGYTYPVALRAILTQDPNVILIGELRDAETARMAIRAAQTGHLVLTALHAHDASAAICQLLDMGIEPFLLASTLKIVLAQRLVRRLCPHCRVSMHPTIDQMRDIPETSALTGHFFVSKGCAACHYFGFKGRIGAFQALPNSPGLCQLIARAATVTEIRQWARTSGVATLRQAAMRMAERGETSLDEVLRETPSSDT